MKRFILILLLLFSLYNPAFGVFGVDGVSTPTTIDTVSSPASVDGVTATVACTLADTYGTQNDETSSIFSVSGNQKAGFEFDVGTGYVMTKMEVWLDYGDGGTCSGTVTPYICPDASGEPACDDSACSPECQAGTPVACGSLPAAGDYYGFLFSGGYSLSSSTIYWIVLSDSAYGSAEWFYIRHDIGLGNEKDIAVNAATSWSPNYTNIQVHMKGYYGSCN